MKTEGFGVRVMVQASCAREFTGFCLLNPSTGNFEKFLQNSEFLPCPASPSNSPQPSPEPATPPAALSSQPIPAPLRWLCVPCAVAPRLNLASLVSVVMRPFFALVFFGVCLLSRTLKFPSRHQARHTVGGSFLLLTK